MKEFEGWLKNEGSRQTKRRLSRYGDNDDEQHRDAINNENGEAILEMRRRGYRIWMQLDEMKARPNSGSRNHKQHTIRAWHSIA